MIRAFDAFNFVELATLNGPSPSGGAPADELERLKSWLEKNASAGFSTKAAGKAEVKAAGDELEVSILGVIGGGFFFEGVSARSIKRILDENKSAKKIRALVDSPGGDYFDGVAIMNLFKRHAAHVTIEILGEASSAASVISMGGDRIEMHVGTVMMIHRAWSFAVGNGDELRSYAELLDKVDGGLVSLYTARTGIAQDEIQKLVNATTWMSAEDAKGKGFADAVLPAKAKEKPSNGPTPEPSTGSQNRSPAASARRLPAFGP